MFRTNDGKRGIDATGGATQDEKKTMVEKMCQYICCCFSCLQRPDESKNEFVEERNAHMVQGQDSKGAQYGAMAGQHRGPGGLTNKRS